MKALFVRFHKKQAALGAFFLGVQATCKLLLHRLTLTSSNAAGHFRLQRGQGRLHCRHRLARGEEHELAKAEPAMGHRGPCPRPLCHFTGDSLGITESGLKPIEEGKTLEAKISKEKVFHARPMPPQASTDVCKPPNLRRSGGERCQVSLHEVQQMLCAFDLPY